MIGYAEAVEVWLLAQELALKGGACDGRLLSTRHNRGARGGPGRISGSSSSRYGCGCSTLTCDGVAVVGVPATAKKGEVLMSKKSNPEAVEDCELKGKTILSNTT